MTLNELDFVDPDVRALFVNSAGSWYLGTPAIVQLSKDVRTLNAIMKELLDELRAQRVPVTEAIDHVRSSVDDVYNLIHDMNERH